MTPRRAGARASRLRALEERTARWVGFSASGIRRGAANAGWLVSGTYIAYGLSILSFLLVARRLGPSDYGSLGTALAYVGVLGFLTLPGFDKVLTRALARGEHDAEVLYGRLVTLNLLAGAAGVVLGLGGLVLFSVAPGAGTAAAVLLVTVLTQPLSTLVSAVFRGHQDMKWIALVDLGRQCVFLAAVAPLVFLLEGDARVVAVAACMAASYALALTANFVIVRRYLPRPLQMLSPRLSWPVARSGLVFSAFSIFFFLFTRVDVLLASHWVTAAQVGLFVVAFTVADRVWTPVSLLGNVLFPLAAGEAGRGRGLTRTMMLRSSAVFGLVGAALASAAWLLSGPAVDVLLGEQYRGSLQPLSLLLVAAVFSAVQLPVSTMLQATGREMLVLKTLPVRAGLNVVLDVAFLERGWGIVGVAWSTVITMLVYAIVMHVVGWRALGKTARPSDDLGGPVDLGV